MTEGFDVHIRGGTLVPMVRDREWFRGDLLIRDGRIAAVTRGPTEDVTAQSTLDASDALVLPGFVQAHVHVVQSLLRHQADGLELLPWLRDHVWPYEAALDGDGVQAAAELGIAELICGGTTTALDFGTTHNHDRVFAAARDLGIRLISGKCHMNSGNDVPQALVEDTDRSLAEAQELGLRWHGAAGRRLSYAVAPRFALSCTREMLEGCADLARNHGWLLQTHASENRAEVAAVRRLTGCETIEYLDTTGLIGDDVVIAHGVHLQPDERDLLARSRTRICHCPGANLKLGSGIADVPAMLAVGVPVTLGADGAPCNNRLSAVHEMGLAATLHNLNGGVRAIDGWTVLAMATREGARALHLGADLGTLAIGKAADVIVIDMTGWSLLPGGDPASRVIYGASSADVRHVVVDGRPLVVAHELCHVNSRDLRARVDEAWQATRARMKESP